MEAKESCGGCVYPFYVGQKPGVDCASLPGVRRAFCFMGQCQIHECNSGWEPAPDKSSCERLPGDFPESMSLGADELDELGISAEGAHAKSSWIRGVAEHSKPVRPRDSAGGHTDAKGSHPNSEGASKGTGDFSTNYKSRMARHDPADSKSHNTQREQTRVSKPKQRSSMRVGQDSFPLM
ncbi:hypothetical protein FRC08_010029 [Ceratobasidium sp. 394]|nr:hypothetical protein FRC08_010029 [Ceratobasidium sp. 394]